MAGVDTDFANYVEWADAFSKDLVAEFGEEKAKRLFQRVSREEFRNFWDAAANDANKRRWLERYAAGYRSDADKKAA
jgi:hypothetical protein